MDTSAPDRLTEPEAFKAWRACMQGHAIAQIAGTLSNLAVQVHTGQLNDYGDEWMVAEVMSSLAQWALTEHAYWSREGRLESKDGRESLARARAEYEASMTDVTDEIGDFLAGS